MYEVEITICVYIYIKKVYIYQKSIYAYIWKRIRHKCIHMQMNKMTRTAADERAMLYCWGYDKEWIIIYEYEHMINLKRNIHIFENGFEIYACM